MRFSLMHCGGISVKGEAEEVISKEGEKPHHGRRKSSSSSNPFSGMGLDKFATLNAELSAKREYVAKKTGTPESLVRFVHTSKGWAPVVVKNGHNSSKDKEALYLAPTGSRRYEERHEESHGSNPRGNDIVEADGGCDNASSSSQMSVKMSWRSGYVQTSAFGVLTISAIMVRKFGVPAVAMAVVMVVGYLQRQWMGGVIFTRSFIDSALSYLSQLFIHWNTSLRVKPGPPKERLRVKPGPPKERFQFRNPNLFSAPKGSSRDKHINTQLEVRERKRQLGRVVSMDGQPIREEEIDATLGAILMLFLLFLLVFYGRLPAICFTSAYWYVLPKLRIECKKRVVSNQQESSVSG